MRMIYALVVAGLLFLAVGCGGDAATEDEYSPAPPPIYVSAPPSDGVQANFTVAELGDVIVRAGSFWEDWWYMRGPFSFSAGESVFVQSEGEPAGVGMGFTPLAGASGFETMDDVDMYLLQYFTAETLAGMPIPLREIDGVLHFADGRAGFPRFDWDSAEFSIIEQDGGRAVVEAVLLHGYFILAPGQHVMLQFYMEDGRIDGVVGGCLVTATLRDWNEPAAFAWESFSKELNDMTLFIDRAEHVNLGSFDALHHAYHGILWPAYGGGEEMVIWATQQIFDVELIYFENDWDAEAEELIFRVLRRYRIADTLLPGEGLNILGYSSLGTLPWSGISFIDAAGGGHHLAIHHDFSDSPHWYNMWNITGQMR
jgi:hypothetical protein